MFVPDEYFKVCIMFTIKALVTTIRTFTLSVGSVYFLAIIRLTFKTGQRNALAYFKKKKVLASLSLGIIIVKLILSYYWSSSEIS